MNKALLFNTILLMIITSVIFFSSSYHKTFALNNSHNNATITNLTFSLPFNSHFADQAIHQKDISINSIPFP